ncbi:metallophosphoesterase [bacterium]|nr:metallophosphoesterase [bacterium]
MGILILVFSNSKSLKARSEDTIDLLVTSDLHGWISTSQVFPNRERKGLLHLFGYIKNHRKKNPHFILLDAGDLLQGSPITHYYHSLKINPAIDDPFFKIVRSLNYDAVTVGNHDLAIGFVFEQDYVPNSNFTWLGANILRDSKPVFKPYKVFQKGDLKIVVLGLTTPGSMMWLNPDQLNGLKIQSVAKSALKWLKIIKETENPDFIIGLFHVGLNSVRDDENSKLSKISNANSTQEAIHQARGFDFVITGHDHRLSPRESGQPIRYIEKTPVIEAGHWGETLLMIKLRIIKRENGWELKNIEVLHERASQAKEIDLDYSKMLSRKYKEYLFEELPWKLTKTTKNKVSVCLNTLNALAQDQIGLAGTMLPKIGVKTIRNSLGRRIKRLDLLRWQGYDNKSVTIKASKRDIYLLGHPDPEYGQKRISYNKVLFPWIKAPLKDYDDNSMWLKPSQYERKYLIKICDYHYEGGGGIIPQLFLRKGDFVERSDVSTRDRLFSFLKSERKSLPKECDFLKYESLSEP